MEKKWKPVTAAATCICPISQESTVKLSRDKLIGPSFIVTKAATKLRALISEMRSIVNIYSVAVRSIDKQVTQDISSCT